MANSIKTFVFMDLETTGLPFYESNKTKITELCLTAVLKEHIELGVFPRARNTLNLCFNPRRLIDAEAEKLTGLSNFLLENYGEFQEDTCEILLKYLELHSKPICLVAHNGYKFDYPIFKAEIARLNKSFPEEILCIDSLEAFKDLLSNYNNGLIEKSHIPKEKIVNITQTYKQLDLRSPGSSVSHGMSEIQITNETTPKAKKIKCDENILKYQALQGCTVGEHSAEVRKELFPELKANKFDLNLKLGNIYYFLKKEQPKDTHCAAGDVNILLEISAIFGEKFVNWAEKNAKKFSDIPKMERGKKIGT